jgi:hypothetical protein
MENSKVKTLKRMIESKQNIIEYDNKEISKNLLNLK